MMETYDAIVCGAGVGGLALAIALGRQGRRVLVVEKQRMEIAVHKGEFLQPHALTILHELGVLPQLLSRGALHAEVLSCRDAEGNLLGEMDYRLLPGQFNFGLLHYYREIKSAFLAALGDSVEVRFGTRILRLLRRLDGQIEGARLITGQQEYDVSAPLTVGADGRLSTVRELLGINGGMHRYDHQMLALNLEHITNLPPVIVSYLSRHGVRTLYPMPGNRARLYVQIHADELRLIKERGMDWWRGQLLATTPALATLADHLPADLRGVQVLGAWRYCAPKWIARGAGLIGDAAHSVHPMAGQGMNAAIEDAYALAQALQSASGGLPLDATLVNRALTAYEAARRASFEYTATLSHRLSLVCTATSFFGRCFARRVARNSGRNRGLQYKVAYNMAGLGIQRLSSLDRLRQIGLWPRPLAPQVCI